MTGLLSLLYLCLQPPLVSVLLLPPTNLRLFSQNFQHILTWVEPNDEPFISYDVSYSKDYRRVVPAINCSNITIRRCDLTKHFTDIFSEYKPGVQSFTHKKRSNLTFYQFRLNPKINTTVGPPIVDVAACDSCLDLSIRPPISYLWSEKEQRNVTMLGPDVFAKMDYLIHFVPPLDVPIKRRTSKEHYTTQISSLLPNTNYCVSVVITGIMNYKQVPSPMKCVVTKGAQGKGDTRIYYIAVTAVIFAIGLMMILCALDKAGYISRKKMLTPNALKSLQNLNFLLERNESVSPASLIFMETVRDSEMEGDRCLSATGEQENASYITNNPAIRIMGQHMKNENFLTREELSMENSPLSNASLQLEGVNIFGDATISFSTTNIAEEHPVFCVMSNMTMGVQCPSDNAFRREDTKGTSYLLNRNKKCTIDFSSVSIANPGDLWACSRTAEQKEPQITKDPTDLLQFRHFSDVLILDEPQMSNLENETEVEDMPCKDHEQVSSDYIKR
ncbi:uncharacterized protein [Dendrobates tinctorius]|uniref:uncharacterized protein n=1 Tax=Dendrobates tinctorius TaxID=92724 RepID=UPI003CC9BE73